MNGILGKVLDDRFASRKANEQLQISTSGKPIVDLALDTYLNDGTQRSSDKIDPTFKEFAIDQIKLFLFAGHDTTSTTTSYMYHLLYRNPSALHAVRKELDDVLGLDFAQGPRILTENPHLLNKLHYSNAVIKETLRLYPPLSSARTGEPGFFLEHDGIKYPTEGFLVRPPDETQMPRILTRVIDSYRNTRFASSGGLLEGSYQVHTRALARKGRRPSSACERYLATVRAWTEELHRARTCNDRN